MKIPKLLQLHATQSVPPAQLNDGDDLSQPVPPKNPEFEEVWTDRLAFVESTNLFMEDIDLNGGPQEVLSALSRDTATEVEKNATNPKRKRVVYASLILTFLLGLVAVVCVIQASKGSSSGPATLDFEFTDSQLTVDSTSSSSQPEASPTGDVSETESTSTTATTTTEQESTTPSTLATDDLEELLTCTNVKIHQELLSSTEKCVGECSSQVVLDGDRAVVRYGDKIYSFSNEDGTHWKKSNTVFKGTSSDIVLALSGELTVLSDFTTDDLNRDVFLVEHGSADNVHKLALNPETYDEVEFGRNIDIDGDLMAVAAPGAVYIYEYFHDDWYLYHVLTPDDNEYGYDFGEQIAVKEGKLAVTAFDTNGRAAVFIHEKQGHYWGKVQDHIAIDSCDEDEEDCEDVGLSIAFLEDGSLMVASPRKGAVQYYTQSADGEDYGLKQEISFGDTDIYDDWSISVSGNMAVLSLSYSDESKIHILVKPSDIWEKATSISYTEFVSGVSLSEQNLMVSVYDRVLWYTIGPCEL